MLVFHHRRIHPHLPPGDDLLLLGDLDHALMDLGDPFGSHLSRQPSHRLVVDHRGAADTGELPVEEVGPHLAGEDRVAPAAHVLQQQHAQHYFGGGAES